MTDDLWWRHRHQQNFMPDPDWADRCARWLQRSRSDLGPAGWLVLLQPQHIDPSFSFGEGTYEVATTLRWGAAVTGEDFEVEIEPAWVAPRDDTSVVAIDIRARRARTTVASARRTYRLAERHPARGAPEGPPAPEESHDTIRALRLTLDENQVRTFAEISNTHHPLHERPGYAHKQGFPGVIVQGPLLAATVMHHARPGTEGTARFWFLRAVSAGTLLRLEQVAATEGTDRWQIRKPGGDVAALAEIDHTSRS